MRLFQHDYYKSSRGIQACEGPAAQGYYTVDNTAAATDSGATGIAQAPEGKYTVDGNGFATTTGAVDVLDAEAGTYHRR